MRIFLPMLLERVRTIMLLRHKAVSTDVLAHYTPGERELMTACASEPKSSINSAFLLRLLEAGDRISTAHIPTLPLELAVLESLT